MRAIILSAGQGHRLLPHTAGIPKCLLPVDGRRSILELQLDALSACGIRAATIMVGFGAEKVEALLRRTGHNDLDVRTRYNPFFRQSDNLITCWLAAAEMDEDFLLLNGDTLFESAVLARLLAAPSGPVSMAIDRKPDYTDDDMKVTLGPAMRLLTVSKNIPASLINGESIGLIRFIAEGAEAFRAGLNRAVRDPAALRKWYLDVLNDLARSIVVSAVSIEGLWWTEIDSSADLADVRADFALRVQGLAPTARSGEPAGTNGAEPAQPGADRCDAVPGGGRPYATGRSL